MNIQYLQEILSRNEEIQVIGKNALIDDVVCNVMGILRRGTEMRLLILQYDENFRQVMEEKEILELSGAPSAPESNRALMRGRKIEASNPFHSVSKVFMGEREFHVNSSEYQPLNTQDWEHILTIAKFLSNGWQPSEIGYPNINTLFLTSLILEGDYASIPAFNQNPEMRFVLGPRSITHQVEKPITLVVGGHYPDKILFQDAATGEEHWAQINRVYLSDMWEEMGKTFADPRLGDYMTSEEIAQAKLDFEKKFQKICPKGMYFPVIEYECDEDISLMFYSKSYLDAKPLHSNSCMAFILRPDQPTGILGLKLKAAVIQEPVPADTNIIEAELFQYTRTLPCGDIKLD